MDETKVGKIIMIGGTGRGDMSPAHCLSYFADPTYIVEAGRGKLKTVQARLCREATPEEAISYWMYRAKSAEQDRDREILRREFPPSGETIYGGTFSAPAHTPSNQVPQHVIDNINKNLKDYC